MPRKRPVAPQCEGGSSGPTPTPLPIAVSQWMRRVERYVERSPRTGEITGIRDDPQEQDPRALDAKAGAIHLCRAGGFVVDGSSPPCRAFWRLWARDVLPITGFEGDDFLVELRRVDASIENRVPEGVPLAPLLRGLAAKLAELGEQFPPTSGEHYAALLEAACMMLDAAKVEGARGEEVRYSSQAATVIGWLQTTDLAELMLPHARRDLKMQPGRRKGARVTNALRRDVTVSLAQKFDDFRRQYPELTQAEAADAFLRRLPADVRLGSRDALLRRVRRGRRPAPKK